MSFGYGEKHKIRDAMSKMGDRLKKEGFSSDYIEKKVKDLAEKEHRRQDKEKNNGKQFF